MSVYSNHLFLFNNSSKNSIIKDRIKEIEIKKNNKNLNIDKNYIDEIMLKYFQKFNLNSINEIHNIINTKFHNHVFLVCNIFRIIM